MKDQLETTANAGKFLDPFVTADGSARATVPLSDPQTLWFNTGTLCNITCANCYIDSSPVNDALVYLTLEEVSEYLDQLQARNWGVAEIGFTGGEPFMNPQIIAMLETALARGYRALVLTNAMRPMMRPRVMAGLVDLQARFGDRLVLRVSLDHWSAEHHDAERGRGGFDKTLAGMRWLRDAGISMAVAGRTIWGEGEAEARAAYARLFAAEGFEIDAMNPGACVLFPEMDTSIDVPEITTACWGILGKSPDMVMCASSRMVVKRKGADRPAVLACTLLPYDPQFELGTTLAEAERDVALNHPHCAKFCVLGGASCSA
ncbi:radical SAM protein [Mesobacterium sp. TK19101]|uniref:Radical SAM protein n=1 Tax=Mesobacterium hydrothermale TaxID=3111907 RepID=A0ABU6HL13_9RHOB|nr:radical SAM protein [Mesobacterium sp. TK19101]MEC3863051.1 radical SAM protein [Mesobacterium sp. TK19101]